MVFAKLLPVALFTVMAPLTVNTKPELTVKVAAFPVKVIEAHAALAVTVTISPASI